MNINSLPLELLEEVFKHLSDQEKINASTVCQTWHKAALRNVTRLFCYDEACNIPRHRTYCYDLFLEDDLKNLKTFYEESLKENVNWWDLFVHFLKLKHLEVIVENLEEGILDAISSHVPELDHLFLSVEHTPEGYHWKHFGSKLTKLTSLKVEFHWEEHAGDDFVHMIPFCRNLRKIDIGFVGLSNTLKGIIPKQVTDARFMRCWDDRTNKGGSLFAFIFEDPTTIKTFVWEEDEINSNLRELDVVPLTGVVQLEMDTGSSVERAVFEHCKFLENLFIRNCNVRQLSRVKHVLPRVRTFKCLKLCGNAEDLRQFCPIAREIDTGYPCESCDEHSE